LKIYRLTAENFKKVSFVDITPNGHMVEITGPNGSGKTSVIDSIVEAMNGTDRNGTPLPIKKGAKKAVIEIDLGEFKVKKIITTKTVKLEVTQNGGPPLKSPQAVIDKFIGKFSFDPRAFFDLSPENQRNTLLDMLSVSDDVKKINTTIEKYKSNRADQVTHRNVLSNGTQKGTLVEATHQDIGVEITSQLVAAKKLDLDREKLRELEVECASIAQKIDEFQGNLQRKKKLQAELRTDLETRPAASTETAQQQIDAINANNEKAAAWDVHCKCLRDIVTFNKAIEDWDTQIAGLKQQRNDIVSQADMPIEGMSIGDGGLEINEVPLKQISTAEQYKVSTYLAMRLNPELKVIRISDGSLLDMASKKVIMDLAKQFDYQIWIETISDDNQGVGFFMEEGRIAEVGTGEAANAGIAE
jgi:predicted ATP-dependent endonuclease of OLD family